MIFDLQIYPLPNEILIIIFSKLDWKNVQCVKKVCKRFHSIIETNLIRMEKRKIQDLYIYEFIDENDKRQMHTNFSFIKQNCSNDNEGKELKKFNLTNTSSSIFEHYIKRINIKELGNVTITAQRDTKIFEIFNKYAGNEVSVKNLCINVNNLEDGHNFIEFMTKLKNVEIIEMTNVCLINNCIPINFVIPTTKNLLYFSVRECKCTPFVNKEMIKQLLLNNPDIRKISLDSTRPNCDAEIVEVIKEKQYNNQDKECHNKIFNLSFICRERVDLEEKFHEYFDQSPYKLHQVGILPERVAYFNATLPCHNSTNNQEISIIFEHRIFSSNSECKSSK